MIYRYDDLGEEKPLEISPETLSINQPVRAVPLPDHPAINNSGDDVARITDITQAAQLAAETGMRALKGESGPAYDSLVYSCALTLWHAGRHDSLEKAARQVRNVLDSGSAAELIV
jgi:anthranilate phosphoribosyltransferase